jgi:septum formation protein
MMAPGAPKLVLASKSASRAALLHDAGLVFETRAALVDEAEVKAAAQAAAMPVEDTAILLAEMKALRVSRRERDAVVIGADQMLVCDGIWFDKPPDRAAARTQLQALRGRAHRLVTAVVVARGGERIWHHLAQPVMTMRRFSDDFLEAYLDAEGAAVLGSVGAYRLEGPGVQLFDAVAGDHSAVLGLPLLPLLGFLRQHGVLMV